MKKLDIRIKTAILIFIGTILIFIPFSGVSAKTFKLTLGAGIPADPLPFGKEFRYFWAPEVKKRVETETDHKIEWTFQFAGAVAKLSEEFEAVEMGLLDVGMVFPIFENPELFIHNYAYFAPFGTPDIKMATKVNLKVYDNNPWLKNIFEKKYNQKWVGTFTYERYNIVTTFAWKTINDLKGHKIAAAGPNLPWIKTIGCVPVQGNALEAYTGLQTGVYDGWLLPDSGFTSFKLYEVAKYFTRVGFGCISAASITVNLDVWNSLPKEVQQIMLEVGREYSDAVAQATEIKNLAASKIMKEKGVTFYTLPIEEKRRWMKSLGNLAKVKAKEADKLGQPGSKILKYYVEEMAKEGYEWPVKWEID